MPRDEHLDMIDNAKLFCRDSVRAIERGDWKSAAHILLDRCRTLDIALQSLTPGGSEYVGDPDRCVLRAKENLNTYRKLWQDAVAANRS